MKAISSVPSVILQSVILGVLCGLLVECAPRPGFFEKLFGLSSYPSDNGYYSGGGRGYNSDYREYGGYSGGYGGSSSSGGRRQKQGRSYSDICRVVTVNNYASPGARIFPAAPFCPYG